MAKKIRKMLGDLNAPETIALMRLIDTQSRLTICNWCIDYAQQHILPVFEKNYPDDARPRKALKAARGYLEGKVKFPDVKNIILNECHAAARELDGNPSAQAAARTCGQAAAVVHTLSHCLGLYFYGAAALAYDRLGLDATEDEYRVFAVQMCTDLTESLQTVSVKNEPNPAKIKWYC